MVLEVPFQIGTGAGVIKSTDLVRGVNPLSLGAVGDGKADDTIPVYLAIQESILSKLPVVITRPHAVSSVGYSNVENVTMAMLGDGRLIGLTGTDNIFVLNDCADVNLINPWIIGKGSGVVDVGIFANNYSGLRIINPRVTGCATKGILLQTALNPLNKPNLILGQQVRSCQIGIWFDMGAEYITVMGGVITDCSDHGIIGGLGNCYIIGNQVIDNMYGLAMVGSLGSNPDHGTILGNSFNHNQVYGIKLENNVNNELLEANVALSTGYSTNFRTTASITSGSNVATLAKAIKCVNGHAVKIAGAGVAGADLITTITGGAGTTSLLLAASASTTVSAADMKLVWPTTGKNHSILINNGYNLRVAHNRFGENPYIYGHAKCNYVDNELLYDGLTEMSHPTGALAGTYPKNTDVLYFANDAKAKTVTSLADDVRVQKRLNTENGQMASTSKVNPTLLNNWTNTAGYTQAAYWIDDEGTVHIEGVLTGGAGSAGAVIFNLPAGFRPTVSGDFVTVGNGNTLGAVRIYLNGDVQQVSGGTALFSLNGINFKP